MFLLMRERLGIGKKFIWGDELMYKSLNITRDLNN